MPRFKPSDYNQMEMIPISLEKQLVPGSLEFAIHFILEHKMKQVQKRRLRR